VLSGLFRTEGRVARATSPRVNPVLRAADMAVSVLRWRAQVDVVVLHVYSGRAFVTADLLAWEVRRMGLPLVMALHGGGLPAFSHRHPVWVARVLRRATHLVAPSAFMARHFANYARPVTVIPNTVRLEDYEYRERADLRPRLLWMRAFSDIYRPCLAIETLARLRTAVPDATLTMAGQPGPLLEPARALARRLGVADGVEFPGFLTPAAKRRAFREHDVFLVTTRVENAPVSVVEAAASGLPVVACRVGGLGDLLEDGRSGLLVDEPAELDGAVRRLLDDPSLAGTLSRSGRVLAETFDWPAFTIRPFQPSASIWRCHPALS
jgi:glycosyltransferase involved in cell wall biosynthesis